MPVLSWQDTLGELVTLTFDVVEMVTRTVETDITEHAVEDGADITDHARTTGMIIEMSGYVSNTPLYSTVGGEKNSRWEAVDIPGPVQRIPIGYAASIATPTAGPQSLAQAAFGAIAGAVASAPKATMLVRDWVSRVKEIEQLLDETQESARLCSFDDSEQSFENLLIQSRGVTRTTDDGDGATFSLTLKRIRVVSAQLVDAPVPAEPRLAPLKSVGSKAAKAAKGDEEKQAELQETLESSTFDGSGNSKSLLKRLVS